MKKDMKGLLSPWKGVKKAQKVSKAEEQSRKFTKNRRRRQKRPIMAQRHKKVTESA